MEGGQSPAEMAQLARRRMRRKLRELELALSGRVEEHHRFLLGVQMRRIEAAEADLAELDKRLREKLAPYSKQLRLLMRIPGVDWIIAATIIAEIGVDIERVRQRRAFGLLDRHLPRQSPKRWQAARWQDTQGQRAPQDGTRHRSHCRRQGTRHVLADRTAASRAAVAPCGLPSQSATRSRWPPITCGPPAMTTRTWAAAISTSSTPIALPAACSAGCDRWDTT